MPVDLPGTVRDGERTAIDVVIEDVSAAGFRIRRGPELEIDEAITLGVAGLGVRAAVVVRSTDHSYGCEFRETLNPGELHAILFASPIDPIPFVSRGGDQLAYPPEPSLYPRRVRLLGIVGLAAACWGVIAATVAIF